MPDPYSDEVRAIVKFVESTGLLHRVTDVNTPGVHSATSWHYAKTATGTGTAVDFAGTTAGTSPAMVAQMSAIWRAFRPVAPQLAELFFQAPDILMVVKNGAWRPGLSTLGKATWDAHKNHVHVAVRPGTFLVPTAPARPLAVDSHTETIPIPVHDFEEAATKTTRMIIGPLDKDGNGWSTWDPGFARDPVVVAVTLHGPSPVDDGYWSQQANVTLAAQPRGGKLLVTVRNGTAGDTVTAWVTVS